MKKSLFLVLIFLSVASTLLAAESSIQIIDIKMVRGIDEKFQPIGPSKNFPAGTVKVFCWFEWKDAEVKSPITAKWTYVTESIPILDYPFSIPRKQGAGGVALAMPEGKTFPSGRYEVQLMQDKKILKSLKFEILEEKQESHHDAPRPSF